MGDRAVAALPSDQPGGRGQDPTAGLRRDAASYGLAARASDGA